MGFEADAGVLFSNPAASRFSGGRHGDAVIELRVAELLPEALASGSEATNSVEVFTPTRANLGIRIVPVSLDAKDPLAAIVFIRDLTQQSRVDAMRRDFVANVSHELRTPLGALAVLAGALKDAEGAQTRERLSGRLEVQAQRMANLIDDLLDLSVVEGDISPPGDVSMSNVIREAVAQMGPTAVEHRIALEVEDGTVDVVIPGKENQLVSAVANLLENALKYTFDGDGERSAVTLRSYATEHDAVVEVEDHGIGIAAAHVDRIFERFYRADKARSRDTGGTGLGLAIVRQVARNHGGRAEVESDLGRGSTFRLVLSREAGRA